MYQERLQEARSLIKEHRYDEARHILIKVDHPTAREWLAKLDKIAPPKSKRTFPLRIFIIFGVACITAIGLLILVLIASNNKENSFNKQNQEAVTLFCMSVSEAALSREECSQFAESVIQDPKFSDIVAHCTQLYAENLDSFGVCMQDVVTELNRRNDNGLAQVGILFDYCDDDSPDGAAFNPSMDQDCYDWANQINILYPGHLSASECWQAVGSRISRDLK